MSIDLLLLKNKSVLFAEDDKVVREQMREILELIFKNVMIAKDGEEAFQMYEEKKPDILLIDIMMPKKDGLKLAKQIRQNDYNIPIVVLTSFVDRNLLMKSVNLSLDGYLVKPAGLNTITDTICKAIKRKSIDLKILKIAEGTYYNHGTKELTKNGKKISLGVKEQEFFELLLNNYTKTVTKEKIEHTLWIDKPACDSALKFLVSRLRKKLGKETIVSVRGIGYKLNFNLESDSSI